MTAFLASVTSAEEVRMVMNEADIIDLKNPALGALGALPHPLVESLVRLVGGRKPVSATIGDLPMSKNTVCEAVECMANTGVDIVKVGFFGSEGHVECANALASISGYCKIVAVLFADQQPDFSLLETLAETGFHGVMLDTSDKLSGSLQRWLDHELLQQFVAKGRSEGLVTGLAGSLGLEDITGLAEMDPDYLGFRGALCHDSLRQSPVDSERVQSVAALLRKYNRPGLPESVRIALKRRVPYSSSQL